ncbi:MAG: oxygen-independent coproporphyrinogen III oxidase-like protein [Gammaproteobacteria bacterium]|nr:oxygen-independent coproporphyrinogen III oxidase-like protein [Gammaproteobacteria bacterium]
MFDFAALPPLSLYVHIPWCVRKCPYCDFNSHAAGAELPEKDYVDALSSDLEQDLSQAQGRVLESIFIGGGTPSLFSPRGIADLLAVVRARLPLRPDIEITLEANPGTMEQGKFREFRAAGVNRLSLGVQSFHDDLLRRIGRIHGRDQAVRAVEAAHEAGFDDFNLDLMYGLPGQSAAQALDDARTACDLAPAHISHYQLTLEPNTLFHRYPPPLPDDDACWDMQRRCQALLAGRGYAQYEVSAYARPGHRCRHNLNYWRFGDYLGIGAGAHAKITRPGAIARAWKLRQPREYLDSAGSAARIGDTVRISPADAGFEFMLNALRLTQGVGAGLFHERTGLPLAMFEAALMEARRRCLLEEDRDCLRATPRGYRFLNDLVGLFLPQSEVRDQR